MQYKVLVITTQDNCCAQSTSISKEVEEACNNMGAQGWVLVTAYPEAVNVPCSNQHKRAVFMIFGRQ